MVKDGMVDGRLWKQKSSIRGALAERYKQQVVGAIDRDQPPAPVQTTEESAGSRSVPAQQPML